MKIEIRDISGGSVELRRLGESITINNSRPRVSTPKEIVGNNGIGVMEIEKNFIVR